MDKCEIVKVLGFHCSTKQAAGDVELGTAGGKKIYNWYHRIRGTTASDEIWKMRMELESQIISEERAKHAQDWKISQARGVRGLAPKFKPMNNIKVAAIKQIFTAKSSIAFRRKLFKKLLAGDWQLRSLKKHIDTELRMNAIFSAIFAHTKMDSLEELQKVYGETFGWDWIKTHLVSFFPKKPKASDEFPKIAATTLQHKARSIQLLR